MKLQQAFDVVRGDVVAFIGAGGKTSALFNLGHELAEQGWRVAATTTTRISLDQLEMMPYAVTPREGNGALSMALEEFGFVFVYDQIRSGHVYGPPLDYFPKMLDSVASDVLLIEADTARGLPLKAPFDDEPVIPPETSLVIPVASLSVLGKELNEDTVYNAQAIMDRYGFIEGQRIKSPWVAQVLRDETLGLARVPDKARVVALLNSVPEHGFLRGRARLIGRLILRSTRVNGVAIGTVRGAGPIHEVQRPVAAIVLAAGMSRRMGQPKVLLPWTQKSTILEHIINQLLLARVDHIVVVTGNRAGEVRRLATGRGVEVVHNPDYESGEILSSVKAGLSALPDHIAGAMIVLGDQPRIQPKVVSQVMMAYAEGRGYLVAPRYQDERGHPILIDRRYWSEFLALPADGAPRDVLKKYKDQIAHVDVDTDSVLRDVDTPDDYQRERGRAGLI
jgi:molybdenum cofactor cytidylyltransferase